MSRDSAAGSIRVRNVAGLWLAALPFSPVDLAVIISGQSRGDVRDCQLWWTGRPELLGQPSRFGLRVSAFPHNRPPFSYSKRKVEPLPRRLFARRLRFAPAAQASGGMRMATMID